MASLFSQAPRIWPRRSRKDDPAPLSFQVPSMFRAKPRSKSVDAHRFIRRRGMTPPPPILHPVFSTDGNDVEIIMDGPAPEPLRSHPPTYHSYPSRRGYDMVEVAPRRGRVPRREVFHSRESSRGRSSARVVIARKSSSRDRGTLVSYSPTRQITFEEVRHPHSRSRSSRRHGSPILTRSISRSHAPIIHMEPVEGTGRPARRSMVSRTPSPTGSRHSEFSPISTGSPISSYSSNPPTPRQRSSSRGPPPALTWSPVQRGREPLTSVIEAPTPTWEGFPAPPLRRQRSYVREREPSIAPPHHRTNSAPLMHHAHRTNVVPIANSARYRYTPVEDDHTHIKEIVREMEQGGRRRRPASVPPPPPSSVGRGRRSRGHGGHKRTQSASFIASETSIWPSSNVGSDAEHHRRASISAFGRGAGSRSLPRVVSFERLRDNDSVAPSESVSMVARSEAYPTRPVEYVAASSTKASSTTSKRSSSSSSSSSRRRSRSATRRSSTHNSDASTTTPSKVSATSKKTSASSSAAPSSPVFARRRGALGAAPKFSERFSVCLNSDVDPDWPVSSVGADSNWPTSSTATSTSPEQDARRMRRVRKMLRFADWSPSDD